MQSDEAADGYQTLFFLEFPLSSELFQLFVFGELSGKFRQLKVCSQGRKTVVIFFDSKHLRNHFK